MRSVQTPHGDVPVWGDFDTFRPDAPAMLVIRGAFPERDHLLGLATALPHVDIAFVHLPGMHTPFFSESTPRRFAEAFDEVVGTIFRDRSPIVLALSMGGLAGFAMTTPAAVLALDTPLRTGGLWPLLGGLRQYARETPQLSDWIWQLFGVAADGFVLERDYRELLTGLRAPARVLLGSDPLGEPRTITRIPSLVSGDDRAVYAAASMVRTTVVQGAGHNIPRDGQPAFMQVLYRYVGEPPPG